MTKPSEPAGWSRAELEALIAEASAHLKAQAKFGEEATETEDIASRLIDAIMALAPPSSLDGNQGVMAERCVGTDTAAPTSPSSAGSVAGQWRTIDSAPTDGTEIIGYRPDQGVFTFRHAWMEEFVPKDQNGDPTEDYDDELKGWFHDLWGWMEGDLCPTHWQPLPEPPDAGGVKLPQTDPTGSADSQDTAPAGPTVGAKTPSPPLADGEPETP